jgi:hypothetical protein
LDETWHNIPCVEDGEAGGWYRVGSIRRYGWGAGQVKSILAFKISCLWRVPEGSIGNRVKRWLLVDDSWLGVKSLLEMEDILLLPGDEGGSFWHQVLHFYHALGVTNLNK